MSSIAVPLAPVKIGAILLAELLQAGWRPGAPARVSLLARTIDAQTCQEVVCSGCYGQGAAYRPFVKGDSYRVVGLCLACGSAEEL